MMDIKDELLTCHICGKKYVEVEGKKRVWKPDCECLWKLNERNTRKRLLRWRK